MNDNREGGDSVGYTNELGRVIGAGDRARFGELFERVTPALYAWAHLRLRGRMRNALEVQDLVQEVWLRALQSFPSYDPARSFRAWILGIAKNVLLQALARSGRRTLPAEGSSGSQPGLIDIPASVTSVSLRLAKEDWLQHFLALVDSLPDEDRLLVLYCAIESRTAAEAGARLGISAAAATKRWQTLRARLRENGPLLVLALDGD